MILSSYLDMMKIEGINERIFNEIKEISKLDFDFEEESEPHWNVLDLSSQMRIYPSELIKTIDITYEYNPKIISSYLNELKPDNVSVFLISRDFSNDCDLVEPVYKTNYKVEDIPKAWKDRWQSLERYSDMFLPEPNIYIPKDLSLKKSDISFNGKENPGR